MPYKKKFTHRKNPSLQISQNVRMAESLWVIIMNRSVSEYLAEVHLQFDVELIVGQVKSRDLVVFQEAYRVDNDYPLRISQFGKWTRSNGLDIPANHLYERRSDLEGKLLKVGSIEVNNLISFNIHQFQNPNQALKFVQTKVVGNSSMLLKNKQEDPQNQNIHCNIIPILF